MCTAFHQRTSFCATLYRCSPWISGENLLQTSEIQPPYWSFHFESSKSLFTSLSLVSCWTHRSVLTCLEDSWTIWGKKGLINSTHYHLKYSSHWLEYLCWIIIEFQIPLIQSDLEVFQACHCALRASELRVLI